MTNWFKSTTLAAALGAIMAGNAFADGLSAQVNTSQLAEGDTFQLVLSTDGQGGAIPDLLPLHQDFDVLGTSQSSQIQIINGHRLQSQSWIVSLSPKAKGTVTIPSLSAGTLTSDPLTLNVMDASQLPKSQGIGGISVSAAIDDGSHYVFQEIPLKVRIETAFPLQQAQLIVPTGDFELTKTGEDQITQIKRNGQALNVIERSYLLRPQAQGNLTIPPFTLRGSVRSSNARRDSFGASGFGSAQMQQMMNRMGFGSVFDDMFSPGKPFIARTDALQLNVLANPGVGTSGWFLPAKAVKIEAERQPANPVFREGEAVTRRVSLLALGARPEQLPDLKLDEPTGARIYLDDTQTDMVETKDGTVARRDYILSIVPTQGGNVTLPEISVEWMDTLNDEMKIAKLDALTIAVEGTVHAAVTPPVSKEQTITTPAEKADYTLWYGLVLFLSVVVVFVVYVKRRNKMEPPAKPLVRTKNQMAELRQRAQDGDHMGFYSALLSLRAAPQGANLKAINTAIEALESYNFAPDKAVSEPDLFAIVKTLGLRQVRPHSALFKRRVERALPALYPAE